MGAPLGRSLGRLNGPFDWIFGRQYQIQQQWHQLYTCWICGFSVIQGSCKTSSRSNTDIALAGLIKNLLVYLERVAATLSGILSGNEEGYKEVGFICV